MYDHHQHVDLFIFISSLAFEFLLESHTSSLFTFAPQQPKWLMVSLCERHQAGMMTQIHLAASW